MLRKAFIALSWLAALGAAALGAIHGITQASTTSATASIAVAGALGAVLIGALANKPPFVVSATAAFAVAVIAASRIIEDRSTSSVSPTVE